MFSYDLKKLLIFQLVKSGKVFEKDDTVTVVLIGWLIAEEERIWFELCESF